MGPSYAAELFVKENPSVDFVKVILYGSLAKTGKGHMTDRVIEEAFGERNCEIVMDTKTPTDFHPNTMDFFAYKDGLAKANPVILEPIGELKAVVPDSLVGDVIGDVNKRRGRVLGMNAIPNKKGYQMVEAEVPISEMTDYTISLRAMSQGRGSFTFYFTRYEEAPAPVAQKIIAEAQKDED